MLPKGPGLGVQGGASTQGQPRTHPNSVLKREVSKPTSVTLFLDVVEKTGRKSPKTASFGIHEAAGVTVLLAPRGSHVGSSRTLQNLPEATAPAPARDGVPE